MFQNVPCAMPDLSRKYYENPFTRLHMSGAYQLNKGRPNDENKSARTCSMYFYESVLVSCCAKICTNLTLPEDLQLLRKTSKSSGTPKTAEEE